MSISDGIELTCIDESKAIKGKDYIDQDIRFGYLAYGVVEPFGLFAKDKFLVFKLVQ